MPHGCTPFVYLVVAMVRQHGSRRVARAAFIALASVLLAPAGASAAAPLPDPPAVPSALPGPPPSSRREPPRAYFYKGYDYGVQSLYGPIWAMLNRGYDALQLREDRTMAISLVDTRNVLENLADPFPAIRYYGEDGWGSFLKTEVFPLSYGQSTARWLPNLGLHLLGGGQTYAWMREWFLAREAPELAASLFAGAALMAGALVNESIENKGVVGYNTDAIADVYLFDLGGIALFSFEAVRKFFGKTLALSDWSLQPALTLPHGHLHNVGSYYALKVPLPVVDRVKLFAYGGVATMGGVSVKLDRELTLSGGFGGRVSSFENSGGVQRVENVVRFRPTGALFLDRNESLLAMVQVADIDDYTFSANVYPNAFFHTDPGVGAWSAIGRDGRWTLGVSFTRAFGLGFGLGTR